MDGDFKLLETVEAPRSTGPVSARASAMVLTGPYPPTAELPTQSAARGIEFDFNAGARVVLPTRMDGGSWRVRLRDLDTGNILFETTTPGATVNSSKRYFIRFGLEVWDGDVQVLDHVYEARERDVLVQFPVGTLGDILAWFPYAARFAEEHRCHLTCAMSGLIIPLLRDAYPSIRFVTHEEAVQQGLAATFYATYSLGLFFDDADHVWQPCDFRLVGLHRTAGYILGVDPTEEAPRLALPDESRPIEAPYVCIAVQSSSQPKYWNNPHGWREVVAFLKEAGYRVICIDQKATHGTGLVWNHIPHGAEDHTGDLPLVERARWLRHAAFFIGTSSGLSWLAWAASTPVVLISGFTQATNEFATPYRVINYHACNSCWNDVRHRFVHHDFLWCPRHAGTERQFECTKLITPEQVKNTIRRIPAFVEVSDPPRAAAPAVGG
ncbi:MAG: autotransporter strand-loop-strand O-heptosyltransferase [Janthinobacterium lividum]